MVRLGFTLVPVALVTLAPQDISLEAIRGGLRMCRACGSTEASDGILNLLLFVPFGWVMGRRWGVPTALGWGLAVSAGIEGLQLFIPGRFTSAADLLANSVGAGFGAWVARRPRLPVGLAVTGATVALFSPGVLLRPYPPAMGAYYGQWTAVFGGMEAYGGDVVDARVAGLEVPSWRSDSSAVIRAALRAGAPVRLRVRTGPPPSGEAPIFSIFDEHEQEMFMLGADGEDIFVRVWRLGTTLRFQTPTWWWEDALAGVAVGDTINLTYGLGEHSPCLTLDGRTRCLSSSASLGGWDLLAPPGRGDPVVTFAGLLWAFLLGAPFGMLSLSFRGKVLWTAGLGAGVALVSWTLPYWVTPWWGILLMFTGMIVASLMEPWIRKTLEA